MAPHPRSSTVHCYASPYGFLHEPTRVILLVRREVVLVALAAEAAGVGALVDQPSDRLVFGGERGRAPASGEPPRPPALLAQPLLCEPRLLLEPLARVDLDRRVEHEHDGIEQGEPASEGGGERGHVCGV